MAAEILVQSLAARALGDVGRRGPSSVYPAQLFHRSYR